MMKPDNKKTLGFTVIELMIATAVFSLVLLIFLSAFIQVSQLFYKGVNLSNTQEAARSVVQNISDDIQFERLTPDVYPAQQFFCIGSHRYVYQKAVQYAPGGNNYGILKEKLAAGCVPPSGPGSVAPDVKNGQELLDPGMQLNKLDINCTGLQCVVSLRIVYYGSDSSVLTSPSGFTPAASAPDATCIGQPNSTQYCATADYSSTILQRF